MKLVITSGIVLYSFILSAYYAEVYHPFTPEKTFYADTTSTGWYEYNGAGNRNHYSPLKQITLENVARLKPAWVYASGGADTTSNFSQIQCNPIIINNVLFGVSANTQVFALDASNGKELWKTSLNDNEGTTSRGVTYYQDKYDKRIFFGAGKWLYCIDATNGKLITSFGKNGRIDLQTGLKRPGADNYVVSNTPNTIFRDLIITGVRVSESETALLGDIRAYQVRTGKLAWTFRTIPAPGDPGYATWSPALPRHHVGGANAWAGMAIDRKRGIVYVPTGSAAFDFYGGNRKGDNLYANCLLALDATTGKKLWHFQLVHHDIWDRDPPAPPNLVTVMHNGKRTDAVAQVTKQGFVFVFDRVTGKPLFKIIEKKFPLNGVPGEKPSATQPIPTKPAPFTRQEFLEENFNDFVADRDSLAHLLKQARTGGPYIPIGKNMTIFFPGTDGGAQWGGAAADTEGILYVPAKELPVYTSLIDVEQPSAVNASAGSGLYISACSACHGRDRAGNHDGSIPSLLQKEKKLSATAIAQIMLHGKGMMPSFSHLTEKERAAITSYLLNDKSSPGGMITDSKKLLPYRHTGYNRWYDRNGYPVSSPPWGTITAINLNTGERIWQVPLGEYKTLTDKGYPPTGTDNYGGPLVTASGLLFIAASRDELFRAFDKTNGKIVWQASLPAAAYASPSTYSVKGKQYIVIACGGGKLKTKSGDKYIAFALGD